MSRKTKIIILCCMMLQLCFVSISAQQPKTIIVQRGETFELLANRHHITLDALKEANPNATTCHVGMQLTIPAPPPPPPVTITSYTNEDIAASTTPTKVKKKKGNGFWKALGWTLLGGAVLLSTQASSSSYTPSYQRIQRRTPMPVYTGNGSSYVAQIQARTNQQMADLNTRMQQMTQAGVAQIQQQSDRMLKALMELSDWAYAFKTQNGREPYEIEKDDWMKAHYPDLYQSYIVSKYSDHSPKVEESKAQDGPSEPKEYSSPRTCPYCGGSGREVVEQSTLSFGLPEKRKKCQECGAWIMSDEAHYHRTCSHCKGKKVVQ